jgi:acylphosphatase
MIRPKIIRNRVIIRGHVQGVYFRAECGSEASRLGVSGWVGNQPDGSVYAEFEGPAAEVDAMIAWCHTGPSRARVTHVEVTPLEPTGEAGFSVH